MALTLGGWALSGLLLLNGCSKAPFTQSVRDRFGLTPADLRRIQFFNSEDIVLQREAESQVRSLENSELVMRGGVRVEQVTISERTPCVALRVEADYMLMGFSPKDPSAALWFRVARDGESERAAERRYELVALENGLSEPEPFQPRWSKGFLVQWSRKDYHVITGRGAYLTYDLDNEFERDTVHESAPGWRLSERPLPRIPQSAPVPESAPGEGVTPDAGASYDEL